MVPVLEVAPWYQAFSRSRKHLKGYAIAQLKSIYDSAVRPLWVYYLRI